MGTKKLLDVINVTLNKEGVLALIELVGKEKIVNLLADPNVVRYVDKYGSVAEKKSLSKGALTYMTKPTLAVLLSYHLSEDGNVRALYDRLSPLMKNLLQTCAREYLVNSDTIPDEVYEDMVSVEETSWGRVACRFSHKYSVFFEHYNYGYSYYDEPDTYLLRLNSLASLIFRDILKLCNFEKNISYEPSSEWRIFSQKGDVFKLVESCRMLMKRDAISVSVSPTAAVCRKFASLAGVDEILPSGEKLWKWWRTVLLIRSMSFVPKSVSTENDVRSAVKFLLGAMENKYDYYCASKYLYPHLKGFNRSGAPNHAPLVKLAKKTLHDLSDGTSVWIDFEDFMKYLRLVSEEEWYFMGYAKQYYYGDAQKVGTYDGISYLLLYKYYTEPVIKAFFFVLATYGLADLAIDDCDACEYSGYDPIRAVRLTSLGSYILGFSDSYELVSDSENEYDVFDDRLIVKVKSSSANAENLLTDVMLDLGGGRFLMTEASLLKNCRSGAEVDSKIDFFKMMVSPNKDLPKVWQDFFAAVKLKSGGLSQSSLSGYVLYSIDPSREDLLRIFSTDDYISSHCARVEGYRVLIEKSALSYIFAKLRSMGYLIER